MHNYAHCTLLTHSIPHIHGRKYRRRSLLIWLLWSHTQTHTLSDIKHSLWAFIYLAFGNAEFYRLYTVCVLLFFFSCVFVADFSHSKWKECEFICTIDYIEIFVCDVVSGTADAITAFANCLPPHSSAHFILCCVQFKNSLRTDSWCGASERIQSDQWFDHNETTIRFHMYMNTSVVMENQFCFSFSSLYVRNMTLSLQYFIPSFNLIWCDQWSKLFARFILHFPLIPSHFSRILSDSRRFSSAEFSSKISCTIKRYEMSQVCLVSKWLIYGGVECIVTH